MDAATLRDIIVGAVGSGVWSLGAWTGIQGLRAAQRLVSGENTLLLTALDGATKALLDSGSFGDETQRIRLGAYLRSPELQSIVRQLFSTALAQGIDAGSMHAIRQEFLASLSLHLDVDPSRLAPFANAFLNSLMTAIQRLLADATERGVLAAHEAQSAARQHVLLGEIANIQKNLELLTAPIRPDVERILDFERKYREQVAFVHSQIKPPNFDSGRRVPIDELFVAPRLARIKREKQSEPDSVSFEEFCSTLGRVVLLGNPGGGKSTLATKLCHSLASGNNKETMLRSQLTPLMVILREFGSQKKISNCSIVQFLGLQAASRYQLEPPPMAFEYLLLNGRALIIFDGLDELLETSFRQEITANVEAFCKLYPAVAALITSREVGYEQAPLNERNFSLFRLAQFDDKQVREYAHVFVN